MLRAEGNQIIQRASTYAGNIRGGNMIRVGHPKKNIDSLFFVIVALIEDIPQQIVIKSWENGD